MTNQERFSFYTSYEYWIWYVYVELMMRETFKIDVAVKNVI